MPNPHADGVLPDFISPVSTLHSGSTLDFDYYLANGRIFIRSRTSSDPKNFVGGDLVSVKGEPNALEWKPLEGSGIPYDKMLRSLLEPGEEIVEMGVASGIVAAVSNLRRVYLYKPTDFTRPLYWDSLLGAPDFWGKDKLFLPEEYRDWALSCSVCVKPETRRTDFINPQEIVRYFSDANGVHFDFGFTATIYVLHKDGQKILYWDTGLPASFSRGFLVPEGMQGQSISVAGSTVFLSAVDAQGKLHFYTRMIDYEINGGCPGLKVGYTDVPVVHPPEGPDGSFFLGFGVRKMPLNGWVEHDVSAISPNLTHKVCIRLTGQGDEARELRIQGKHPILGDGYYFKNIAEGNWGFCSAPVEPVAKVAFPFNPDLPQTTKLHYNCTTRKSSFFGVTLELKEFNPFLTDAEPCYLVIRHAGEAPQHLRIHAVDAWGLHYHRERDEDLIGSVDGEPKALLGTLVLTPEQIELAKNNKTPLEKYLNKFFLAYHGKTKAMRLVADEGRVALTLDNEQTWNFRRSLSDAEKANSFYMKKAMDKQLTAIPVSHEECAALLAKNQACLKEIQAIFKSRRVDDLEFALMNMDISAIRPLASGFFKVVNPDDPTYKQAVEDLRQPLKAHTDATTHHLSGKNHPIGYGKALSILRERIKYLHKLMNHPFELDVAERAAVTQLD